MLEFLLLGSAFGYYQFNKYIDNAFLAGNLSAQRKNVRDGCQYSVTPVITEFGFSRKEFMLVSVYQYLFALFLFVVVIYCMFLLDFSQSVWKRGFKYGLVNALMSSHGLYREFAAVDGSFKRKVLGGFAASLVANYLTVNMLIAYRGTEIDPRTKLPVGVVKGEYDKDVKKIKLDHTIVVTASVFVHFITFLIINI